MMITTNNEETGIKFIGFYTYPKILEGVKRKMVKMVCCEKDLQDTVNILTSKISTYRKPKEDFYICVYDFNETIPKKIKEIKLK